MAKQGIMNISAGKADSTLVRGAQAIASQKYKPVELPKDRTGELVKGITGSITDAIGSITKKKEQLEIEHEKQLKPFQSIAEEASKKISAQKEPLPQKIVDAVESEVARLQDKFDEVNVVGKKDTRANEKARMEITAELSRITNEAINTRANFTQMGKSAGDWNPSLIDSSNIDPMKSVLDLAGMDKNDGVSVAFVDGKLTFNTKKYSKGTRRVRGPEDSRLGFVNEEYQYGDSVSFTSNQMLEALPLKNLKNDSMLLENQISFTKQGKNDGKYNEPNYFRNTDGTLNQFAYDEEKTALAGEIADDKQFQDMASRRMSKINMPSFKMGLFQRMDIPVSVLDNMFTNEGGERVQYSDVFAELDSTGPEGKPDGKITPEDLVGLKGNEATAFENNLDQIIDALTNINNPAFNLETSKDMLADYYTNIKMQAYENNYYANGGKKVENKKTVVKKAEESTQLPFPDPLPEEKENAQFVNLDSVKPITSR